MEGEDKTKKVSEEKRSVKKPKNLWALVKGRRASCSETLSCAEEYLCWNLEEPVGSRRTKERTYERVQLRIPHRRVMQKLGNWVMNLDWYKPSSS